ncbi:hypothetical protein AKJ16_DCAP11445 [Drosera capensis]
MEWSPASAANAYLATIKLCGDSMRQCSCRRVSEPGRHELIAALAAGINTKLIVEVALHVSPLTIALAAAARETGGEFICILPNNVLNDSKFVLQDSGLVDNVEFVIGDPMDLLPNYKNVDFVLIDCRVENYMMILKLLETNPRRAVIVANNLLPGRPGLRGYIRGLKDKVFVRSIKHLIDDEGMEISVIGSKDQIAKKRQLYYRNVAHGNEERVGGCGSSGEQSKWVHKIDEESGEEHIFRVLRTS